MIKISQAFVWLVLSVICAVAAFYLGRWTAPVHEESSLAASLPAVASIDSGAPPQVPAGNSGGQPELLAPASTAVTGGPDAARGKPSYRADLLRFEQLMALAKTNPAAAMQQSGMLRGELKLKAEKEILSLWAERDPNGVWSWLTANRRTSNALFIAVLEPIARSQPNVAIAFAESMVAEHRELRRDIYQSLVTGLAQNGAYAQAVTLIERLTLEPDSKAAFIDQLVDVWASYEPQAALAWLNRQPLDYKEKHLDKLMKSWAAGDPAVAVEAAMSLTGEHRNVLLQSAFPKWLEQDAPAAANWLSAQTPTAELDSLIAESVSAGQWADQPREALKWAEKITTEELRLSAITGQLSIMKQQNPSMALAQLRALNTLSQAQKDQLYIDLAFKSTDQY